VTMGKKMPKILILYYSRTGNTQKMAEAVAEGAKTIQGVEVVLEYHVTPEILVGFGAIVIGVPTYQHVVTFDMMRLFEETAMRKINIKNKIGASFGSYGWSGEAPGLVLEIMKNKFEMNVIEPPLLIKYAPDQTGLDKCREFGRKIAERLMLQT